MARQLVEAMNFLAGVRISILLAIALLGSACANTKELRDSELALIDEWLPGVYDNRPQVDEDLAKNVAEVHEPREIVILPVAVPIIGEHVFYMESHDYMNPRRVLAQHLYSFDPSADKEAIVLTIYRFKEPDRWAGGKGRSDIFKSIVPDDLNTSSGCLVKWEFDGERFTGTSLLTTCRAPAGAGVGGFLELRFELEPNELRMSERSLDAAGNVTLGRRNDPLFVFRKTGHESD